MPIKNARAGCCYQCANYVAIGAGELVKNQVPGHRFVLRCGPCSARAAKPEASKRPSEASMSPAAVTLYRQSLRKDLMSLLQDEDMPAEYVRPGQAWLEAKPRPLKALYAFKDRLIQLRNQGRDNRLNGRPLAA
jgi:hypothetical protein